MSQTQVQVTHIPVSFLLQYRDELLRQTDGIAAASGSTEDLQALALEITYQRGKRDGIAMLLKDYHEYVNPNIPEGHSTTDPTAANPIAPNPAQLAETQGNAILNDAEDSSGLVEELNRMSSETIPLHPDLQG